MGASRVSVSTRNRFVACFLPEKMSKDVGKVPIAVVLAHFENISSQKPLSAQPFAIKSTFWSRVKKSLIFYDL